MLKGNPVTLKSNSSITSCKFKDFITTNSAGHITKANLCLNQFFSTTKNKLRNCFRKLVDCSGAGFEVCLFSQAREERLDQYKYTQGRQYFLTDARSAMVSRSVPICVAFEPTFLLEAYSFPQLAVACHQKAILLCDAPQSPFLRSSLLLRRS